MRVLTRLNSGWRYLDRFEEAFLAVDFPLGDWAEVCLPHTNRELPYDGFDPALSHFVSSYARDLRLPPEAFKAGARVFLDFEGVMAACSVHVDGREAGWHAGGYSPFSIEISDYLPQREAGERTPGPLRILVKVDSREDPFIPPFGGVIDYLCYGGIYREAALRVQSASYIGDLFALPRRGSGDSWNLEGNVEVFLDAMEDLERLEVGLLLKEGGRVLAETRAKVVAGFCPTASATATGGASALLRLEGLEGLKTWDLDSPALYEAEAELRLGGKLIDRTTRRVGFREAEWRPEGFFLNGRRVHIRGLNRHQSWPHVGYAMPERAQRRDAFILKRELGVNLVRLSHYPQSPAFLDACDELGLLVFEEPPGWQHLGGETWKDRALCEIESMVRRDRSRPSVVIWGVRVNESRDDHELYTATNALARRLDPSRATGGVRYLDHSEFLEDVYTFNDFSHAGGSRVLRRPRSVTGLRRDVPYLVTEHNGHMFPTKRFDQEERLAEQALRHLRVLEASLATPGIAGAVGWCAFDYNTHREFGSGDQICHHGVSDLFRIPKPAAFAYSSQRPPESGIVLEVAPGFCWGERSGGHRLPVWVFTNCEEVELRRGGRRVGIFKPDRRGFPHLEHPPVKLDDLVGERLDAEPLPPRARPFIRRLVARIHARGTESLRWHDYLRFGLFLALHGLDKAATLELLTRLVSDWGAASELWELVGYIKGREVARRSYQPGAPAERLSVRADDERLRSGEEWDVTRILIRAEDRFGNPSPFLSEVVELELTGPGRIIGPSRLALVGGCAACWLRSDGPPGVLRLAVRGTRFPTAEISVNVG